ncbi:PLDc N-terminal domain-containing protein [Leucobacter sp. G161]|uniref:PLDc N-terminal domain-containing protein n=1 Tax=Leucobacter sp. G161 TaxID=663704 RepID=UPI00073C3947|nr:PLDc N-terminal domain-containing protein [Leucobacter sp. G161]KUF06987.1 hypothetical protein AUL38_01365 [Leucobacter sp. G161]
MDFWAILTSMLWAVVFISYLFALFAIITDLFRDHTLSGWWKALWALFLIFLPFVTALVYLIARGEGMAARSQAAGRDAEAAAATYIRETAGKSPAAEITAAAELLTAGSITHSEFEAIKAKALA